MTPQQQLDVIRDVKLGMSRANAMKKYGIKWHSTLSQIITRRGHQVKVVKATLGNQSSASAAAAVLQKARCGKPHSIRCIIRRPQVSQISHIDPRTAMPDTTDQPAAAAAATGPITGHPAPNDTAPEPASQQHVPAVVRMRVTGRASVRRSNGQMSMEEKIDEALSRISKLNQKLMTRQGLKVFCSCCNREVNFKINTVMARVREHSVTRSHTENIGLTRHQRQQERSDESPVNGSADSAEELPAAGTVRFPPNRRRRRTGYNRPLSRRMVRRRAVPAPPVPTAEEKVKRQQEFERELVQSFLETGIPVHKLNMPPIRDFITKWTGQGVPRYEEKQLDYGF